MKLDRDKVTATAVALLDDVGLDQLTLRRLATELGVKAPALYWHFASKAELLDAMADSLQREIPFLPMAPDQPWQDWLADRMRTQRRMLNAHRDAARLFAGTRPGSQTLHTLDLALESMQRAGFPLGEALRGLFIISDFVAGFVLEEQAAKNRELPENIAAFLAEYPLVSKAFLHTGPPHSDADFEYGLSVILNGMRPGLDHESLQDR
jgi:AcrR family transcriptional regulator